MRYADGMTALNTSSHYTGQYGAALVSGTFWKRWGLSAAGTLQAETVRGPLIIWAKPAAKEEAPKLEAPKPTPLEGRVFGVNTAAHFARFFYAARGRVRHSVRWKTGRKHRNERVKDALHEVRHNARVLEYRAKGGRGLLATSARKCAKNRKQAEKDIREEMLLSRLRDLFPSSYIEYDDYGSEDYTDGIDHFYLDVTEKYIERVKRDGLLAFKGADSFTILLTIKFASAIKVEGVLNVCFAAIDERRVNLKTLLKALEAAAYLDHVRRRVKPAPRRERVPRPIYARPRPPTAPLAPPVTC